MDYLASFIWGYDSRFAFYHKTRQYNIPKRQVGAFQFPTYEIIPTLFPSKNTIERAPFFYGMVFNADETLRIRRGMFAKLDHSSAYQDGMFYIFNLI